MREGCDDARLELVDVVRALRTLIRPHRRPMLRGRDTGNGSGGFCLACRRYVPPGPDVCLGELPGVAWACCGHGTGSAYVVFGDRSEQPVYEIADRVSVQGLAAVQYFRTLGVGPPHPLGYGAMPLTEEEARSIANIMCSVDGGCPQCAGEMLEALAGVFPEHQDLIAASFRASFDAEPPFLASANGTG